MPTEGDSLGRFTTTVPPPPAEYDALWIESELNEIKLALNQIAQAVWLMTAGTATGDRTEPGATATTDDYAIVETTDIGKRFSNTGATKHIAFQLQAATTDQEFEFAVDAAYDIYLVPATGEKFQLGSANELMKLTGEGTLVRIGCTTAGVWRILRSEGTTPTYTDSFRYVGGGIWTMVSGEPVQKAGS